MGERGAAAGDDGGGAARAREGGARGRLAAQRAVGWLASQQFEGLDLRARAARALAAAGAPALAALNGSGDGWGPGGGDGVTSYDSALVMAAIRAAGSAVDLSGPKSEVLSRRRGDGGLSGDGIPVAGGASDVTVTAEIVRALSAVATAGELGASAILVGVAPITPATPTLELAARLAALHALGLGPPDTAALEAELLARSNGTWGADPFTNALGLLAVSTKPGVVLVGGPTDDDDGDGCQNQADAFPQDPAHCLDRDGDGIPDGIDPDRDGDGVLDAQDAFAANPREWRDTDGDGIVGLAEGGQRTSPLRVDSDGDRFADGADGQAAQQGGVTFDLDGDGFADGEADFGIDPADPDDHPGEPGDVAPLGQPDAVIDSADAAVSLRIARDPSVLESLAGDRRTIAEMGADANEDGEIDSADSLVILLEAREPAP